MKSTLSRSFFAIFIIASIIIVSCSIPLKKEEKKTIEVSYNRSIETYFILRALSDSDYVFSELMRKNKREDFKVRPLLYEARRYFKSFKNHPAVLETQKLQIKTQDYGGIVCQGLLYAEELPSFNIKYEPADEFWKSNKGELTNYLKILHNFYNDAKVEDFFRKNNGFYNSAIAEAKSFLNNDVIETMETYFGKKNNEYKMIIIPLNPFGMGFGASTDKVLYEIISPANDIEWRDKPSSYITFGYGGDGVKEYYRDMVIHEFCHSFITNVIELEKWKNEINRYDSLYTTELDSAMQNQGYGDWWSFVNELFVRTGEIRIAKRMSLKSDEAELRKEYFNNNKFILIPECEILMAEYEENRNKYLLIDHFLPKLIKQFQNYNKGEIDSRIKIAGRLN